MSIDSGGPETLADSETARLLPWLSIVGALLCFGSFAVPMKWASVTEANVHPLVYQCYKTAWTLATSLLVLPFEGFAFTSWGIASGFSWVPAGVAAVVAVRHVGLACGQAIWQCTIIATSLVWGFVVLQDEAVYSWWGTALALLGLSLGLVGMTAAFHVGRTRDEADEVLSDPSAPKANVSLGIAAAIFNGAWGGANLVPSHFSELTGVHFVLSFAIGAAVANLAIVCVFVVLAKFCWHMELPAPHFRVMALPGFLSGCLWSAGNFCSLYAVNTVGQGIGYSLIQASVIVSGLWGIAYYRELSGRPVLYWAACCAVCVAGIIGLAAERKPS